MSKKTLGVFLAILLCTGLLQAHGGFTHFMGTVTAINGDHVTVKDQAGKSTVLMLNKSTKYLRDNKAAKAADLKVGTRVMIDATMDQKMKMYTAAQVQLGATTGGEPAAKGSQK